MSEQLALAERLKTHVYTLAGDIGERNVLMPEALRAAADYIEREWREQGYPVVRQSYVAGGIDCANLEVVIPGRSAEAEILLLGAHYDSVFGSPGADDNASGVAALLEMSRLLAGDRPERAVRFVAFVNEEPPFFGGSQMGSMVYAREAKRRGDAIRMMISLEMLGCYSSAPGSQQYPPLLKRFFPDRGNFLALVSDWGSRRVLRQVVKAFRANSDFPLETLAAPIVVPGIAASDHWSFSRHGYPAIMATDTAFYRNAWYHSAGDRPEHLDYCSFAAATSGLARTVRSLAHGNGS